MEDLCSVNANGGDTSSNKKRSRDETEAEVGVEVELLEVKRLKENLLDGLEEEDGGADEFCSSTSQDLDSFMKSFEEEITNSPPSGGVVDLTATEPDLGYLLGASDDELGLPPTASSELRSELERLEYEFDGEFWEGAASHGDSFGFGVGETDNYAPLDGGLFDYSDIGFGSGDFLWRSESMPAQ